MRYLKRDDLGVYVPLVLIGGGLGLLVGTYIATKIQQREDDNHDEANPETIKETLDPGDGRTESPGQERSSGRKSRGDLTSPRRTHPDTPIEPGSEDTETPPWYGEFKTLAEDYSGDVREDDMRIDDDFDGAELFDEDPEEFVEGETNWPITLTNPFIGTPSVGMKQVRLVYDLLTERLVRNSNNRETPVKNPEVTLGPNTLEDVINILETQDVPLVFVYDIDGDKLYTLELRDPIKKKPKTATKPRAPKRTVTQYDEVID